MRIIFRRMLQDGVAALLRSAEPSIAQPFRASQKRGYNAVTVA